MTVKTTIARSALAAVAAAGLLFAGTSGAQAVTFTKSGPASNQTVTATSSNALAAGSYRIGICTTATYTGGAPACGANVTVNTTSAGLVTGTTPAFNEAAITNAHAVIGGTQPATFDCSVDSCEVVIVNHATRAFEERVSY